MMNNNPFQCFGQCTTSDEGKIKQKRMPLAETAFQAMSAEEQDRVYRDLYGTEQPIEESPQFIQDKLIELDIEIDLLSDETKKYYFCAVNMEERQQQLLLQQQQQRLLGGDENRDESDDVDEEDDYDNYYYVRSPKFRLMFLRADRFDARMAARRLARYFFVKYELFGEERLHRRIQQEDLFQNMEDKKALIYGGISFVGATDSAGRSIVLFRREQAFRENLISFRRVNFYTFQNVIESNEESQKKGIIMLAYNLGAPRFTRPSDVRVIFSVPRMMFHALPIRVSTIHNCYSDLKEHLIINLFLVVCPKDVRARFHGHHHETHLECMIDLMSYGINPDSLPLTADGQFRHEMLFDYLRSRQQRQQQQQQKQTRTLAK